jgi:hypothetical protein
MPLDSAGLVFVQFFLCEHFSLKNGKNPQHFALGNILVRAEQRLQA